MSKLETIDEDFTKAFVKAMWDGSNISLIVQFVAISIQRIWFQMRFVRSSRTITMNSTSGSPRLTDPSLYKETPRSSKGGVKRDTKIVCYPKEDQYEILVQTTIGDLAMKQSEFIGFPSELYVEKPTAKRGD